MRSTRDRGTQPMLDVLRSYGVKTSAEVIFTGLQEKSFEEADGEASRDCYGISRQRPVALFVGRIAHEKNIDFLFRMAVRSTAPVARYAAGHCRGRAGVKTYR